MAMAKLTDARITCEQLIKDFEDLKVVNQQLDNM